MHSSICYNANRSSIQIAGAILESCHRRGYPNLYRNHDLLHFEADREGAAHCIEAVISEQETVDIRDIPYIKAAKEVAKRLRSFDQTSYAGLPDPIKEQRLQEMADFYAERFGLILDGVDFAGRPMNVEEYVDELSQRTYALQDDVAIPNSLNLDE